ncbi:MAG: PD-(D/E)XK nuclease family protein [Phycisphaerae bacterium]
MFWSISNTRLFHQCQRRWFYKVLYANARAKKDPDRREAYLLSKLQSVSAWRGNIVDDAISTVLVPALNRSQPVTLKSLKHRALAKFDAQLATARRHALREPGCNPTSMNGTFAAIYAMEYEGGISESEIVRARNEVETALDTLFGLTEVRTALKRARYCIAQRALAFPCQSYTVRAVPDLIAFFDDEPPLIVDWKVHFFASTDAWMQLGTYALALCRCTPHRDFPADRLDSLAPEDVRIWEAQLLKNQVRQHTITAEQLQDIDEFIASTGLAMQMAIDGRKGAELSAEDFPVTSNPDQCQRCQFRSLCWKESE